MATKKGVLAAVARLTGAYPFIARDAGDVKQARLQVFEVQFSDIPDEVVIAAIDKLISEREGDYAPSAGSIRQCAIRLMEEANGQQEIDEYHGWEMVMKAAGALGREASEGELKSYFAKRLGEYRADVLTRAVMRMGWRDICNCDTDDLNILRAQFRNMLTQMQSREREDRRTLPQVRTVMQKLAAQLDINTVRPAALPSIRETTGDVHAPARRDTSTDGGK